MIRSNAIEHRFGDAKAWQAKAWQQGGAAAFSSSRTTARRPNTSWISLATSGYQVDLAVDGNDGLCRARSAEYAVMTIDRMLPGIDGITIIRRLREAGIFTPALIISALGEIDDRVRGLRAGGDDYLVKPFAFAELLARVEALARRSDTVVKETVLRVGDLELDLVSRTVSRSGREIELLPREFQVLEYLVRNEGQVVPRAMLLQHVWDLHFDPSTNIIDVYVGRVRRKVDGQQAYPLIHTIRGSGIVSVLLAKTLRSSTFKLALICIGIFGATVVALFGYVYWSTASYRAWPIRSCARRPSLRSCKKPTPAGDAAD